MCVIIHNETGRAIPSEILANSRRLNADGYGRLNLSTGEVLRTIDPKVTDEAAAIPTPAIHHYRLASVGGKGIANVHPFEVKDDWILFMNGTVSGMRRATYSETDTEAIARMLRSIPEENFTKVLSMFDAKFLIANTARGIAERVGKWVKREGIWYSKENVLPRETIAVYGTLRKGQGNHSRYLGGMRAKYIGTGNTVDKFRMKDMGIPYVFDKPNAKRSNHIVVEVYDVDHDLLTGDLDRLEGTPNHYKRRRVKVRLEDGRTRKAWMYFAATNTKDTGGPYISDYLKGKSSIRRYSREWESRWSDGISDIDLFSRPVYRSASSRRDPLSAVVGINTGPLTLNELKAKYTPPSDCPTCHMPLTLEDEWHYCEYCGYYGSSTAELDQA